MKNFARIGKHEPGRMPGPRKMCLYCAHYEKRSGCSEGWCTIRKTPSKEYDKGCDEFEDY